MLRIITFFILLSSSLFAQSYPLNLKELDIPLPQTNDIVLQKILTDESTVFYKLPQVWQHFSPAAKIEEKNTVTGNISVKYTKSVWSIHDISFNPDSHANLNFPWETTAGLNSIKKNPTYANLYKTINFINLPKTNDKIDPIWIIPEKPIKWIYPTGTTLGEVIYVINNNKNYIQEIRTRTKDDSSESWIPNLYRPVENKDEFIRLSGITNYNSSYKHMFFRNPQEDEVHKMDGLVEELPNVDEDIVKKLLSLPFKNVSSDNWSPTSNQDFHILPRDYGFGLISGVDPVACADCHRQTQISVRNLVPKDPTVINQPDTIGNIRGSDGIFTWHPFSKYNNNYTESDSIFFRSYDVNNSLVIYTKFNPSPNKYKLTLSVQKSLKEYELPGIQSSKHEINEGHNDSFKN